MMRLTYLLLLLVAVACAADPVANGIKVDLDAVVAQGEASPVDGLTSAGQPDQAALEVFARSGYVAVIDMRTPGENRGFDEPAAVENLGMGYVAFPVGADDITLDKARELDELLATYDEPVLLHCGSGNRVGALLALREFLVTGDPDVALEKGRDGGMTSLEGKVRDVLDEASGR